MKIVVFLGPSLPLEKARAVLPDALYLPPAKQVDLLSAVGVHRPDVIALIDGEFGQSLSVWHKEILYALDQGVAVYGASSMGALRAAETADFGMIGVGRVYEMYASGEINDDDEVALAHALGESGYRPLSEPMVNLRATFQQACEEGAVDVAVCERLTTIAKSLYFPERSVDRILSEAEAAGLDRLALAAMRAFIRTSYVDLKQRDALQLLATIRDLPAGHRTPRASFKFNRSHLFEVLYNRDRVVRHQGSDVPLVAIANRAALHLPDFNELNFHALNRTLVGTLAELLEVEVTEDEIEQEARRFRTGRRLGETMEFERWLDANDLKPSEFRELMVQLAVCRKLHAWLISSRSGERTTRVILDELRLRGDYQAVASEAACQERTISEHHQDFKETSFSHLSTRDLVLDHLRATRCRIPIHFRQWAEEAGFHGPADLRVELLRARLAREASAGMATQLADALATEATQLAPAT
jgi:hypothetical protein